MSRLRPRGSSVFSGLLLIFVGLLLLLHNYRGFDLTDIFLRWWPLILIFWGAIKIYERTAGARTSPPGAARITSGEVFLVLGVLSLVGVVVAVDQGRRHLSGMDIELPGETFASSIDVAPKPVPPNARITVRGARGNITVRASDEPEIRVAGKVNVKSWSEGAAKRLSEQVSAEIVQNGDGYEVRPTGGGNARVSVDLDITVPKKSLLTIHSEKGDVSVSDMASQVSIDNGNGDIEVRGAGGDVSVDMRKGDAKISDTKGDVKISGHGGSIEAVNASGSFTINGEFVGPVRADKVAKGVRFVSHRTDLTLTQLSGHMEAGSGSLEVVDAPGNLIVRSRDEDISIENAGGKIKIDDRNGNIQVRFSSPPKEDIEIANASAPITLTLPESSSFEIVADCHSGDIESEFESDTLKKTSTESGDSHLEGKYGRGRGPKITLKTTYGSISIHKTS
ncbi:MAG TPA: DUF4097 family beta strand repeat-containing protein [Candidatus Saccharimonadales bacterium]|nr:DUF4097 family beta strand repeat-containing protein [Candidatus Saccharimonadales bacterium]